MLDYNKYIKHDAAPVAGTPASFEALYVTQFAIDERNGNVYFGFMPNTGESLSKGIHYYDYAAGVIKDIPVLTDQAYGICINPNPSVLF